MNRYLMTTRSSYLSSLRRCGVCIMLLAAPLFLASSAYGDLISIGLQEVGVNGGAITTVAMGPGNVTAGGLSYGTFDLVDVSAQDFTVLGPPGLLNTQTLDISTAAGGVLTIWVTAQGLSATNAVNFVSSFAVNTLRGSVFRVDEATVFDTGNGLYTGTGLNAMTFMNIGSAGPFIKTAFPGALYSVTESYTVFDNGMGTGNTNLTIDLSGVPVPEPASLGLIGAGLLGIFALRSRR